MAGRAVSRGTARQRPRSTERQLRLVTATEFHRMKRIPGILTLTFLAVSRIAVASATNQATILQACRAVQANNENIETLRCDLVTTHSYQMQDGTLHPFLRLTGTMIYKKPHLYRLDITKAESFSTTSYSEPTDDTQTFRPQRLLYDRTGVVVYDLETGAIIHPREDLPSEMRYLDNLFGDLLNSLPFHDATLADQYVQDGREMVAVHVVPSPNARDKALTLSDMTMTIDIGSGTLVKTDQLVQDTNLKGVSFVDLPELATYEYEEIGGIQVMRRRESLWDMKYVIQPEGESFQDITVPYRNHLVEERSNLVLNGPMSVAEFEAPRAGAR